MRDHLFLLKRDDPRPLQTQLREEIVSRILTGQLPAGSRMPSCRELAKRLSIARNTVTQTYQDLVLDGFLVSFERSGYFVNREVLAGRVPAEPVGANDDEPQTGPRWSERFRIHPTRQRNIVKPTNWYDYRYPFVCGQVDPELFPLAEWRDCSRQALSLDAVKQWETDSVNEDDPFLVEQVCSHLLSRRGVTARPENVLVTVGAQQAIYLLASLLVGRRTTVGVEVPCYPDAKNIFSLRTGRLIGLEVDDEGVALGPAIGRCDLVYTTPSHQYPSMVTMSRRRREALLRQAAADDFILIEDDYESESNFVSEPTPALKSLDEDGRVIYVSSLSKWLAPGLRLGFMMGPPELIAEARALRRLMLRHPPSNNQRTVALFVAQGHMERQIRKLVCEFKARWQTMAEALERNLPECRFDRNLGGTAFWLECPERVDTRVLQEAARERSILVEPGDVHFLENSPPRNWLRLGFAGVRRENIEPGVRLLRQVMDETFP